MHPFVEFIIHLLIALFGGLFLFSLVALLIQGPDTTENAFKKASWQGGVEQVDKHTVRTTVNGFVFDITKDGDKVFVQEKTPGRSSPVVEIGDDCHRFGQTKAQAAVTYIKNKVEQ